MGDTGTGLGGEWGRQSVPSSTWCWKEEPLGRTQSNLKDT